MSNESISKVRTRKERLRIVPREATLVATRVHNQRSGSAAMRLMTRPHRHHFQDRAPFDPFRERAVVRKVARHTVSEALIVTRCKPSAITEACQVCGDERTAQTCSDQTSVTLRQQCYREHQCHLDSCIHQRYSHYIKGATEHAALRNAPRHRYFQRNWLQDRANQIHRQQNRPRPHEDASKESTDVTRFQSL